MSKCCGYEVHPAAELFPLLADKELKELAEDIKKNGLIYPVIMCDDQVLDGRNRLVACEQVGVGVHFRDFKTYKSEHSPTEWVLATNLKRRQLDASRRAIIAVEALPLLEEEARERQAKLNKPELSLQVGEAEKGKSAAKAAAVTGVSRAYVERAKKLKKDSPEDFQRVANGEVKLTSAGKQSGRGRNPRPEPDNVSILLAVWKKCNNQQKTAFIKATPVAKWLRQHR